MNGNRKSARTGWTDPEEAPDLSTATWRVKLSRVPVKRGRPKAAATKVSTTIRFDADVLAALKSSGPRWQTRANEILRQRLITGKTPAKRA